MTDRIEAISTLLEEAGALLEPAVIAFDPEDGTWTVGFENGGAIAIVCAKALDELVFIVPLGSVPPEAAAQVYEWLLRASYLWQETGGVQAAIDDRGDAVLIYRRARSGLDAGRLAGLLANLHAQRDAWQAIIRAPEGTRSTMSPPGAPPGGIRV